MGRKSLLAHMHQNPIVGLKDNMFAPLIGFGRTHTIPLFNLLSHTLMECLHHLCFTVTIQTNPFIIGKWIKSMEVKGLKSIHNFKWWEFSSRVHNMIVCKLYKWQTIFPWLLQGRWHHLLWRKRRQRGRIVKRRQRGRIVKRRKWGYSSSSFLEIGILRFVERELGFVSQRRGRGRGRRWVAIDREGGMHGVCILTKTT